MSFKEALDDLTPHRLLGLPSLIEGMKPAKIRTIPARNSNMPITTPIDSAGTQKAAALADLRRRRSTLLSGDTGSDTSYTTTIG